MIGVQESIGNVQCGYLNSIFSDAFLDSNQIYAALTEFILLELDGNNSFSKIVYSAMLSQGMISGQQICELLYEQGVLEKDADYDNLVNNVTDAYAFIYNKIKNLEITPDMLALDPCSGSLVVTDPKNGEVLALVSYPSYDANRIGMPVILHHFWKMNRFHCTIGQCCKKRRRAPPIRFAS